MAMFTKNPTPSSVLRTPYASFSFCEPHLFISHSHTPFVAHGAGHASLCCRCTRLHLSHNTPLPFFLFCSQLLTIPVSPHCFYYALPPCFCFCLCFSTGLVSCLVSRQSVSAISQQVLFMFPAAMITPNKILNNHQPVAQWRLV
jgi:hypothetical protein